MGSIYMPDKDKIAYVLKRARAESRLTGKEITERYEELTHVPLSLNTLYGWENGSNGVPLHKLVVLCHIYNIQDFAIFCTPFEVKSISEDVPPILLPDPTLFDIIECYSNDRIYRRNITKAHESIKAQQKMHADGSKKANDERPQEEEG